MNQRTVGGLAVVPFVPLSMILTAQGALAQQIKITLPGRTEDPRAARIVMGSTILAMVLLVVAVALK